MGISQIAAIAVGLIFVYLTLALVCTALNEFIASIVHSRGRWMERWLAQLFEEPKKRNKWLVPFLGEKIEKKSWTERFLTHPLIGPLQLRQNRSPAYIDPGLFTAIIADFLQSPPDLAVDPKKISVSEQPKPPSSDPATARSEAEKALHDGISRLPASDLQRAIVALRSAGARTIDEMKEPLKKWFEANMDRVGGWYKRKTQYVLLALSLIVCLFANADTIRITKRLSTDPGLRDALVKQAEALNAKPKEGEKANAAATPDASLQALKTQIEALDNFGDLLGWPSKPAETADKADGNAPKKEKGLLEAVWSAIWDPVCATFRLLGTLTTSQILGLLLSAFAVSLGAPFWFDMLNKVVNIRAAGMSPSEKAAKASK